MRGAKAKALRRMVSKASLPDRVYQAIQHRGISKNDPVQLTVVLGESKRGLVQKAKDQYVKARAEGKPWSAT